MKLKLNESATVRPEALTVSLLASSSICTGLFNSNTRERNIKVTATLAGVGPLSSPAKVSMLHSETALQQGRKYGYKKTSDTLEYCHIMICDTVMVLYQFVINNLHQGLSAF